MTLERSSFPSAVVHRNSAPPQSYQLLGLMLKCFTDTLKNGTTLPGCWFTVLLYHRLSKLFSIASLFSSGLLRLADKLNYPTKHEYSVFSR